MARAALLALITLAVASTVNAYTKVGDGPCRGAGGGTDKVNSRHASGMTPDQCKAACDAIPADGSDGICAGYASMASGAQECILYGPGMSGSCSTDPSVISPEACAALGTCSDATKTTEATCGECSDPSATDTTTCSSLSGTWSAGVWTSTGVWEEPEGAWTGEFHHTDHIHTVSPNAQYVCWDKDVTDHVGKCSGTATDGTSCKTEFQAGNTYEEDSCKDGCTWTPAPTSPTVKPSHPAVDMIDGYNGQSGACRSTSPANKADSSATPMQDRPPYIYKKNTAFPNFPAGTSPADLAAKCDEMNVKHRADPVTNPATCLGFHSGPWMSLFGSKINEDGPHMEEGWSAWDEGSGTLTLEGTKPNHQYICFINMAPPMPAGWWYFNDGYKRSWSGSIAVSAKPKVVCHIDICESLWAMGVREDQIVGYFNGNPNSWAGQCEGVHCKSAHYELIPDVSDGGTYGLDFDKIDALGADMVIDAAYGCTNEHSYAGDKTRCYADACGQSGMLVYSNYGTNGRTAEETCGLLDDRGIPVITILVMEGFIEAIDAIQRLAIALGDPPNPDTVNHCHDFHDAMTMMQASAQRLQNEGIRVMTAYIGSGQTQTMYLAQPTDDPVLIMLEELGVPMVHIEVTDGRGHYWEFVDYNASASPQTVSRRPDGGEISPADVWLYDTRTHDSHFGGEAAAAEFKATFNNAAWQAGQVGPWPIGSAVGFSYEAGARILNKLRLLFDAAQRVEPAGTCTVADVSQRDRLTGGQFACYDPKPMFPSCPVAGSANTVDDWEITARAHGWIPCTNQKKAAARKRQLARLEARGVSEERINKVLRKIGEDDSDERNPETKKARKESHRLSQKAAEQNAADDDDEL